MVVPNNEGGTPAAEPTKEPAKEPVNQPAAEAPKGDAPAAAPTKEAAKDPTEEAPKPQPVRDALRAARERHEKGEPIVPDEGGEGAKKEPAKEAAPKAGVEEGGETEAGDGAPKGGAPKEEVEKGSGEKAKEPVDAKGKPTGDEAGDDADYVMVKLPPRDRDGDEVPIELPKDLVEDFNRLRNGYLRGEDARAEVERARKLREEVDADKEEIAYIDRELKGDPVGFVLKHVKAPEIRNELLLQLLTEESVWEDEALKEKIAKISRSPELRDTTRVRLERDRLQAERKRERELAEERELREGVRETSKLLWSMVPEEAEPAEGQRFHRRALIEMGDLAGRTGKTKFTRDEIVDHLEKEGFLALAGIDAESARKGAPRSGVSTTGKAEENGDGGKKPARARAPTAEEARATQESLKAKGEAARAAGAYASEGAGATAATVELPREGVKDRIARVRKHGAAALTGG